MPKKTHGLGRGLDILLPDVPEETGGVREIDTGLIDPNPDQPRREFAEESIAQLAASIREQGVLQPVVVTPSPDGRWRLVAGERRWRAARQAGLTSVPAIVRELALQQQMEIALVENIQREDLNPVETALGIRALMDQCGYTQEQVAGRLGMSRPSVANFLRLLSLPEDILALLRNGQLSAGHAKVLAGVPDSDAQRRLAMDAVSRGWNVRQLEEAVRALQEAQPVKPQRSAVKLTPELHELESQLREAVGMQVRITGTEKKGRIVLQYSTAEELEALWERVQRFSAV